MTVLQTLSDDLAAVVDGVGPSLVAIHARKRIPASGFLWRADVVVTNHHVIQREEGITVTFGDGSTAAATLAGRDPSTNIAVLRLERPVAFPTVTAAPEARVGQLVLALGRPGGAVTAALGVLSAVGGEWRTWGGGRIDRYLRPDVAVYDGFSGGLLVNASGGVVGMNTSGLSRGSAMTIPMETVVRVAEQLLKSGRVSRGYIGLGLQPVQLPTAITSLLSPKQQVGLMVVSLDEGAPAAVGGVQLGDVVIAFGDQTVTDPGEVLAHLTGDRIGSPIALRLLRAGQLTVVSILIGERPRQAGRS